MTATPAPSPLLLQKWLAVGRAVTDRRLTPADVAVFWQICNRAGKDHAYPGLTRLALDSGRFRSTVVRCVSKLVQLGYIEVVEPGTRTRATRFRPTFNMVGGVGADTTGGVPADTRGGVGAATKVVSAPTPETVINRKVNDGGGPVSRPAASAAAGPPAGASEHDWRQLVEQRPDLDLERIRQAVELHHKRGCSPQAAGEALRLLAVTHGFRDYRPQYTPPRKTAGKVNGRRRFPASGFAEKDYTKEVQR